jgi:isopentenyl-diphosphate delta-isomerase
MERFALFDEYDRPLHRTKPRPEVHRDGDWHRAAQVFVQNERGELLCHRRHPAKDLYAELWDVCVAGHVGVDEPYEACAVREVFEEIGVVIQPGDLRWLCYLPVVGGDAAKGLLDREHTTIFLWRTDLPLDAFTPQLTEISELAYLAPADIRRDLRAAVPARRFIPLPGHYERSLDRIEALTAPSRN